MSLDVPVSSRKEKKALRDAERAKLKGKKRKRGDTEVQQDGERDELQKDFIPLESAQDVVIEQKEKKSRSHKRKRTATEQEEAASEINGTSQPSTTTSKSKKRKKSHPPNTTTVADESNDNVVDDTATTATEANQSKKSRFILFIGNLPYSTTDASLNAHFKKLAPFTLRHRTDKKTRKSKGFAFLEFENFDRMKTCLKLYHHSLFDPAKVDDSGGAATTAKEGVEGEGEVTVQKKQSRKDKGGGARKINVELTAGGGGKAEGRKEKIKAKNVRLDEQRKRRLEEERKVREKERSKKKGDGGEVDGGAAAEKKKGKVREEHEENVAEDTSGMHPSRLARMKK